MSWCEHARALWTRCLRDEVLCPDATDPSVCGLLGLHWLQCLTLAPRPLPLETSTDATHPWFRAINLYRKLKTVS